MTDTFSQGIESIIPFVPCLSPGCANTPLQMPPSVARAQIEYFLRDDPAFQLRLPCDRCGRESRYSLDAVNAMIPLSRRPRPLPSDNIWAYLLLELETSPTMSERCFLGERVRVRRRSVSAGHALGEMMALSALAPELASGDVITLSSWGKYPVLVGVLRAGKEQPIHFNTSATQSNAVGAFFASKLNGVLQPGNLFCSNPSCAMVFSLRYSEFTSAVERSQHNSAAIGATTAMIILSCEVCGTSRVVDNRSFDDVFKY
jgi:hypothetical protein